MSKSFKDITKQPKKHSISKVLRVRYEEDEAEQDMSKYVGNSFLLINHGEDSDEDI
ncbi:MAG: hypothetical protein JHC33_03765 [Ignisphaera sp.]|nr:hypothetical protein [Ignisphaera sp.]